MGWRRWQKPGDLHCGHHPQLLIRFPEPKLETGASAPGFSVETIFSGRCILKVVKADDGTVYDAANHFGMWGIRKFGPPEGLKNLLVSISEFLPNGGAELTSADKERIYYVIRGSITVTEENGTAHRVDAEDMIYIPAGEKRSMSVNGNIAARVVVIIGLGA
jgi:quercetin dioxygenase-like cupin family protein